MPPRRPPLYDEHASTGARFTGFGGWEMPVEFGSIREEHGAVRSAAGKFDVSHMGRVVVAGPDAGALTDRLVTADVAGLDPGAARYAMVTDGDGVMLDDVVIYRLPEDPPEGSPGAGRDRPAYLFVPNAGHDAEMVDRWTTHRDCWDLTATVANATEAVAMVAVQGPDAVAVLEEVADGVDDIDRFRARYREVAGVPALVSRTGYTGEDGFEALFPADGAATVWGALDCAPCGLGARDTLRIEMGYLLSGQDFHPEENPRNPYEAGVGFAVDLDGEFVGRDALARVAEAGVDERFTGVRLRERGVPRGGYAVTDADGERVGELTSGTMSPTLDEPVGLGYLPAAYGPGEEVAVVIRGDPKAATTVEPPFLEGY